MGMFEFSDNEILSFFAVLVRITVLFAVLPLLGDRFVPSTLKVLFGLATSFIVFPSLTAKGFIHTEDAAVWGSSVAGITWMIVQEAGLALILGYTARLIFDAIQFGGNLVGNFMGFSAANTFDPHQESQTQVIAELQAALATLVFLSLDGHYLMLKAALDSFHWVGLGKAALGSSVSHQLTLFTAKVIEFGVLLSAPIAICLFVVNVAFGIMAKAMPQLNVLVLSFAVSALVGLAILLIGLPEFQSVSGSVLGRVDEWLIDIIKAIKADG